MSIRRPIKNGPLNLFREGTLIKGSSVNIYFVYGYKKNLIPNPDVYIAFGFKDDNVISVSDDELAIIPTGSQLH